MGTPQLLLIGAVMLLGLLGVLVPGVPGSLLCWSAVLWWATNLHTTLTWAVLATATGLLALNQVIQWLLPARRIRDSGLSWRNLFAAGSAAIAGFVVLPVIGAPIGFVTYIYAVERVRLGTHGAAWTATRTAMRAIGRSVLAELFSCLLVAGAWLGAVLFA
ncbi:DUF456 domain-containing protein [Streptomyces sp. H10-C2]|uniref:DUF456 domain-containing protein n=1 Tax=unclassified Streptomyces TaxID=2593676 RepID=UPI0024BAC1B0|nr:MULTISPECIES: DUF456 domain-containing protein [unclassified Streptomyces]MDJ0340733.1 DUF456 domain-containing protein [Streptomyces sp. PH10-H1]MDJ0371995.1 DUF456 domain-containing protein [Streptomyces sp. H10-C2]